jgi:O-antigen ligase
MRALRFEPALLFAHMLTAGALLAVTVLTLIDRGATRAYASPWTLLLWLSQVAPIAALLLRTAGRQTSFALPARHWTWLAAAFGATLVLSALASPYRGPSFLGALTPLSGLAIFFLAHDWLRSAPDHREYRLLRGAAYFFAAVIIASLAPWCARLFGDHARSLAAMLEARNAFPLGHSNYTAGLALLALPWFAAVAWRMQGAARLPWAFACLLALATLFTSGSRGGFAGFGVLVLIALFQARVNWRRFLAWSLLLLAIAAAAAFFNPRTHALLFAPRTPAAQPDISTVQREAMLVAGARMGASRPLLGWGPDATPLAYPRFRAGLAGGVENALQLHSTPVQLWAELGAAGLGCALVFAWFALRKGSAGADSRYLRFAARVSLGGYLAFSLTDYQLDVPVFTYAVAVCAAVLAARERNAPSARARHAVAAGAFAALALAAAFGRRDPTPSLNVRALQLARDPAHQTDALAQLRQSLALNPDQEIAHFNLGWLLVVSEPAAAESHFLAAAHYVPDKGGVYFGLALARLNQAPRDPTPVARALALECLNDPLFLSSPWWREPRLAAVRRETIAQLAAFAEHAAEQLEADEDLRAREARYVATLAEWLDGRASISDILARAHTSERVSYFAARPTPPDFAAAPLRRYRRERLAYPILMRDLDLPPPTDLYDVQENTLATDRFRFLFPPKGWLPSPLLVALLDAPISAKP